MEYAYVRASTNAEKQDLTRQIQYALNNGVEEANIFQEFASAKTLERKELQRLLSILKENDTIYCRDFSRLSRSLKGMLELVDFAKDKKIRLVFGDNGNFTLDCRGKLSVITEMQLLTFSLVNEIQRITLVDAVIDGLNIAREQGRIGGRPKLCREQVLKHYLFCKNYILYKNKQITISELTRLAGFKSRTKAYRWCKILEE